MSRQFVDKVRKSQIAMRPVLPLGQPLDLGYVASVDDDGKFNYRGTLATLLGLNTIGGELPVQESDIRVSVTSGRDVRVGFGTDVTTDGPLSRFAKLKGKASISFGRENAFFLAVDGLTIRQLAEPQALVPAILNAYARGQWEEDWVYVYRIGVARRMTAILASEADTTVLLKGSASTTAGADVDLAAGFKFVASSKAVTQITSRRSVNAFYDAYRVNDGPFSKPVVQAYLRHPFGIDLVEYEERDLAALPDNAFITV